MSGPLIPRLHIVTDDAVLRRPDFLQLSQELLVVLQRRMALHIRSHSAPAATLLELSNALADKCRFVGALLVINDRVDVALASNAGGVQLGARSLPVGRVRELAGARRIGYSAHSAEEAAQAERDGADFILAGTIYASASHPGTVPAGLGLLEACTAACSAPVLAIGGVTPERIRAVESTGAYGVAVIRAIWDAPDPVQAAEESARILYDD